MGDRSFKLKNIFEKVINIKVKFMKIRKKKKIRKMVMALLLCTCQAINLSEISKNYDHA